MEMGTHHSMGAFLEMEVESFPSMIFPVLMGSIKGYRFRDGTNANVVCGVVILPPNCHWRKVDYQMRGLISKSWKTSCQYPVVDLERCHRAQHPELTCGAQYEIDLELYAV
jgi:hypothetical protein